MTYKPTYLPINELIEDCKLGRQSMHYLANLSPRADSPKRQKLTGHIKELVQSEDCSAWIFTKLVALLLHQFHPWELWKRKWRTAKLSMRYQLAEDATDLMPGRHHWPLHSFWVNVMGFRPVGGSTITASLFQCKLFRKSGWQNLNDYSVFAWSNGVAINEWLMTSLIFLCTSSA